jgi:hypothetical protein
MSKIRKGYKLTCEETRTNDKRVYKRDKLAQDNNRISFTSRTALWDTQIGKEHHLQTQYINYFHDSHDIPRLRNVTSALLNLFLVY